MNGQNDNLSTEQRRTVDAIADFGTQHPRRVTAPPEPPAPRPHVAERLVNIVTQMAADVRGGADAADIAGRLHGLATFFDGLSKRAASKAKGAA